MTARAVELIKLVDTRLALQARTERADISNAAIKMREMLGAALGELGALPPSQYFVLGENSLGYVSPLQPESFCVLASGIGGPDWKNGPIPVDWEHMRMATPADFERYRVRPEGHLT